MPRASPMMSSFNAGEVSPHMEGRVDVAKYGNACRAAERVLPMIQGPAKKCAGTRFVAEIKDSSARSWLVRFEFNTQQAYQLEFGNQYIRFYTNHGQVVVSGVSAWVTATSYSVGDLRSNGGVNYYCKTAHTSGVFATDLASGYWYALSGNVYEIPSPWTTADLTNADGTFALRFVESADVVYICHPNYAPRKLMRFGGTNWQIQTFTTRNGPFKDVNSTSTTVYASAQTGAAVTVNASTGIFSSSHVGSMFYIGQASVLSVKQWEAGKTVAIGDRRRSNGVNYVALTAGTTGGNKPVHNSGAVFDGDSGVQWQYEDPGYGYGIITGYTSTTQVTLNVVKAIPFYAVGAGNVTTNWAYGAWSDVEGWPSQVSFYKERLTFGRGQQVWLSVSADYDNFARKDDLGVVSADRAINLTLQSEKVNNLQWFASSDSLICGTAGSEYAIQPITNNQPFGPDNCTAPAVSVFGSRNLIPVRIGEVILFVQRSGLKLRDFLYDNVSNKYQSSDQNVMADHITQGGLTQIVYQQEPYSLVWGVRADGVLVCMTYSREQYDSPPYGGWHRHPIAGSFNGGNAVVECVSVTPAPANDRDEIWMIVKRTINGVTKRYIEYFEYERRINDDPEDAFYVDAGLTLDNSIQVSLTPGAGATTQYQTGVVFTAGSAIWSAGDVGREIHQRYSTLASDGKTLNWKTARAVITGYTDSTHVTCTINSAFQSLSTIAAGGWRMTVTTVSGLGHLEGQTVAINGNGENLPPQIVVGGQITLPTPRSKAQIGLGYKARVQTMRTNAGSADGTSQGKTARINKLAVRLFETLGLKYGPSFDKLDEIDFRSVGDLMDTAIPLFTGDKVLDFDGDYGTDPWVCIQHDYPFSCTLVGLVPVVSAQDYS